MKAYVLQTRVMHDSYTSENLSELLKHTVAEWHLKRYGHMPALITDNAKNIMNAGELAGMKPHRLCCTHD